MDKKIRRKSKLELTWTRLRNNLPELVFQSILITMGVIIALAFEDRVARQKLEKETTAILQNLELEILNNRLTLMAFQTYHDSLIVSLDGMLAARVIPDSVVSEDGIHIERITNTPAPSRFLQETAWQTALASNLVQHFDYKVSYGLTNTYQFQSEVLVKNLRSIDDILFDRKSFARNEGRTTLLLIRRLVREFSQQREEMLQRYFDVLEEIDDRLQKESD